MCYLVQDLVWQKHPHWWLHLPLPIPTWRLTATWSPWKGHGFFLTTTQLYRPNLYKSVQGVLPSRTLTYNLSHLSKKERKQKCLGKGNIWYKYIYIWYIKYDMMIYDIDILKVPHPDPKFMASPWRCNFFGLAAFNCARHCWVRKVQASRPLFPSLGRYGMYSFHKRLTIIYNYNSVYYSIIK